MKKYHMLIGILLIFIMASCQNPTVKRVKGNGYKDTHSFTQKNFTKVVLSVPTLSAKIKQSNVFNVELTIDTNLFDCIQIDARDDTLYIRPSLFYDIQPSEKCSVLITMPLLTGIECTASSYVAVSHFEMPDSTLNLDISKSSKASIEAEVNTLKIRATEGTAVGLRGRAHTLAYECTGSGILSAYHCTVDNVHLNISGEGRAEVTARKLLAAQLAGGAKVLYRGSPSLKKEINGLGEVATGYY